MALIFNLKSVNVQRKATLVVLQRGKIGRLMVHNQQVPYQQMSDLDPSQNA